MKIQVTEQNIKDGIIGSSGSCPVALALRDKGFFARVGTYIRFFESGEEFSKGTLSGKFSQIVTTPEIIDFIDNFDSQLAVQPCEFEIDVPTNVYNS